jgi:hypothetical protein
MRCWRMSQMGEKRKWSRSNGMSVLPLPPAESQSMNLSDGRAMLAARCFAACQSSWRDVRATEKRSTRKFGGTFTTDQGRIYRANRGTTFRGCKTVSSGDVCSRDGDRLAPLAIQDRASCSRHGPDARNDGAAATKQGKSNRYHHPLPRMVGGRNAFQSGPPDVGQGDAE